MGSVLEFPVGFTNLLSQRARLSWRTNRSGCENLSLAIPSSSSVPCGHGNTGSLTTRHLGADPARSAGLYSGTRGASVGLGSEGASVAGAKRALQERFNQTSRNSSRPPSSDPPQSLTTANARAVGAVVAVNRAIRAIRVRLSRLKKSMRSCVLKPERVAAARRPYGEKIPPFRHQVIEIPPIQPVVTEYQWHQLTCPSCGETTRAPWPKGVPSGTYGPRVHATVALCSGSYRLSKRTTAQVMEEVFRVPMSVGTISQSREDHDRGVSRAGGGSPRLCPRATRGASR